MTWGRRVADKMEEAEVVLLCPVSSRMWLTILSGLLLGYAGLIIEAKTSVGCIGWN